MTKLKKILPLVALGAFCLLPLLAKSRYLTTVLVSCMTFAALGVSWNIIGGYASQISWCHSSFVAIGAYSAVILFTRYHLSPLVGMVAGMAVSAAAALLIGSASFRLRGTFFTLSTIAFAEIVRVLALYFKDFTGGAGGLYVTFRGENVWNFQFSSDTPFYFLMLFLTVMVLAASFRLLRSRTGYFLRAVKEDEDAAQSLGIETFRLKLSAFVLSAVCTSAIGSVYAFFVAYIDPYSIASLDLSVKIGTVAIIGGIGTLWGPVLGAFVLVPLTEATNYLLGYQGGASYVLYGIVLMLTVIFKPDGIISFFTGARKPHGAKQAAAALKGAKGGGGR